MSLNGMMRTSVAGMNGQASRLSTVADNIANANTNGYKRVTNEFYSQVIDGGTGTYESGSISNNIRNEIGRQGPIRGSTNPTDLAIEGNGFFVLQSNTGENYLTRAGAFNVNGEGFLVNGNDQYLMGYDISETGSAPVANGYGGLVRISVGSQALRANPSTEGIFVPNLPESATDVVVGNLPSANAGTAEYTARSSLILFDNLGNERQVDLYFTKTTTADEWEVTVFDNADADATSGNFPYGAAALSTQTITFDPSTGYVAGGGAVNVSFTVPSGQTMSIDMTGISQLAENYTIVDAQMDGSAPASIDRVEIDSSGVVNGIYANGYSTPLFQLALATVPSPDNLKKLPGTNFSATIDSGDVLVGVANATGFGAIHSGALEESNVDMAAELTIMIESQRSYTANSKVFKTGSELMEVLVNLAR